MQEAVAAGIGQMSIYPVDAGTDFVNGPPASSNGPDAVDRVRIGIAIARHRTSN